MAQMATTAGPGGTSQSTITTPGLALEDPNDMIRFAYAMALRRRQQQPGYGGGAAAAPPPAQSRPMLGSDPAAATMPQAHDRDLGPTPADFGRENMDKYGNWGTFVDPANIPAGLQDKIMGGQYGRTDNWDSSNPEIMGPQQWKTGKYAHLSGSGPRADANAGGIAAIDQAQQNQDKADLVQRYIAAGMDVPKGL